MNYPSFDQEYVQCMRSIFAVRTRISPSQYCFPQLDPFFGFTYQGLRTLARCVKDTNFRDHINKTWFINAKRKSMTVKALKAQDENQKLAKLYFANPVRQLLNNEIADFELWAHQIREIWRNELVAKAIKNRPTLS